jgi:plasmid stabilization system protein ParE
MAYQVILSPTAESDLDGIVAYVARDNAAAAERLGLELLDAAQLMKTLGHCNGSVRTFSFELPLRSGVVLKA